MKRHQVHGMNQYAATYNTMTRVRSGLTSPSSIDITGRCCGCTVVSCPPPLSYRRTFISGSALLN